MNALVVNSGLWIGVGLFMRKKPGEAREMAPLCQFESVSKRPKAVN